MDLLNLPEASQFTRVPEATLRYWRSQGTGPPSFKLGRRIFYRKADVDAWLAEQMNADRSA